MTNQRPICPECGSPLIVSVDTIGTWSRKINKDGSLHKVINRSSGQPNGPSFLECENRNCNFSYDTEHASHDEHNPSLDSWIEEHRMELWLW